MKQQIFTLFFAAITFFTMANLTNAADTPSVAPNCNLTSFSDTQHIDLNRLKGQVVFVDFWASWCGPCAKSFPFMNDLNRDLKDRGLQIIGVNLDENIEEAKQFLNQLPADFIIVTDAERECAKNFGVKAMPSSYLIDRKGVIRHVHLGFRPDEAEEFRVLIEKLLAESPATP
jgi:thiol-disulfide isomerase/thioredoxin